MSRHPRGMEWDEPWEPAELALPPSTAFPSAAPVPIQDVVEGNVEVNDAGSFFVVSHTHPLPTGLQSGWPDAAARRALVALTGDGAFQDFEIDRALFVDTETTGLAGGTGTYAFLVGCGWLEAGALRVDQCFMRDHGDEPALMAHFAGLARRFDWTVSFNGRRFDLPLLRTRSIMNRVQGSFDALGALDLLLVAHRLWRYRFRRRDLDTLEHEILGIRRNMDIPSSEIPHVYFRYLRTGDARSLIPVMAHNRQDIVSMTSLLARVCEAWNGWNDPNTHAAVVLGVARVFALSGDSDAALTAYARALELGLGDALEPLAQIPLSLGYKRARAWPRAVEVWDTMRVRGGRAAIWAHIELAKYYEHQSCEFGVAIDHVAEAMRRADHFDGRLPVSLGRPVLEHRLRRLERRANHCSSHSDCASLYNSL